MKLPLIYPVIVPPKPAPAPACELIDEDLWKVSVLLRISKVKFELCVLSMSMPALLPESVFDCTTKLWLAAGAVITPPPDEPIEAVSAALT